VQNLVLSQWVTAAHDLSDGGLAVALAEMALAGGVGATIDALPPGPTHAVLFGEDQARYLVAVAPDKLDRVMARIGMETNGCALVIGVAGGDALILPGEAPILLSDLRTAHENPLPAYMAGNERAFHDKG
jgi:phosphoribosylformylglycinamidine synthase